VRVLLVGATGTIGGAVAEALEGRGHEVVRVGATGGDHTVDLARKASIEALFDEVGSVDAVVCAAGIAKFGALEKLDDDAWATSVDNKMMGQVNLVRLGLGQVTRGGSFTLTTGTLSQRPEPGTTAVATVGAAVEGFVKAAALDLEGRARVNAVSPSHVAESRIASGLDAMPGIWAKDLAEYYVRCVEGDDSGVVFEASGPLGPGAA
jgi:NAD(P)-dependent dehydrogenase (short-subunit alcohol dehydrogenase family)